MDNIVFERNYEETEEDTSYCTAIFDQAVSGGFFERYGEMMDKIPKMIVPQDKENYEYLLARCDQFVKRHHGRIYAVVNYQQWDSEINLYLPMLEFDDEEDMSLLRDIGEKAHYVNITPQPEGGFHFHIMINYFEEVMSDLDRDILKYEAMQQDEELSSMFYIPGLTPEGNIIAQRIKETLDRFDAETNVDRTTAFKAVLDKISKMDEESQTLEHMAAMLETLLYMVLNEENGEGDS